MPLPRRPCPSSLGGCCRLGGCCGLGGCGGRGSSSLGGQRQRQRRRRRLRRRWRHLLRLFARAGGAFASDIEDRSIKILDDLGHFSASVVRGKQLREQKNQSKKCTKQTSPSTGRSTFTWPHPSMECIIRSAASNKVDHSRSQFLLCLL